MDKKLIKNLIKSAKELDIAFFDNHKGFRAMGTHPENYKWMFVDEHWSDEDFCEKLSRQIEIVKEINRIKESKNNKTFLTILKEQNLLIN